MDQQLSEDQSSQNQLTSLTNQLAKIGIEITSEKEEKELEQILQDEDLLNLVQTCISKQGSSSTDQFTTATNQYLDNVHTTFQRIEKLCITSENKPSEAIEKEIKQLETQEKSIEAQKTLLEERIQGLSGEIEGVKEMLEGLKKQNEEAGKYRKEYMREIRYQFEKFREQTDGNIKRHLAALEPKSTSDFSIRISVLSEYIKKEKEWVTVCFERAERLREEFDRASRGTKPTKQYPGLKDLRNRLINDEKEKLLLELASEKYDFATKYLKDFVYHNGVMKFDVNSYKKISEEEYKRTVNNLNGQIADLVNEVVDVYSKTHEKEIDEVVKSTDDAYHLRKSYHQYLSTVDGNLRVQKERLDEVAKVIIQEQDEVQKDFDSVDEQLEYLRQCLEKFESLNDNLKDVFDREVNKTSVSVRDEYLLSLYNLMQDLASEDKESGRDEDQDLVIMREDLITLLQSFKEKEREQREESSEAITNNTEALKATCKNVEEAVDLLKSYDELTIAGGGRQNLQKIWEESLDKVHTGRAELDSYLNKVYLRFQNIQKRRAVDPVTGINERDLFAQYVLEKNPHFIRRLKDLE